MEGSSMVDELSRVEDHSKSTVRLNVATESQHSEMSSDQAVKENAMPNEPTQLCQADHEEEKSSPLLSIISENSHRSPAHQELNQPMPIKCHPGGDNQDHMQEGHVTVSEEKLPTQDVQNDHQFQVLENPTEGQSNSSEEQQVVHLVDGQILQIINLQASDGSTIPSDQIQTIAVIQQDSPQTVPSTDNQTSLSTKFPDEKTVSSKNHGVQVLGRGDAEQNHHSPNGFNANLLHTNPELNQPLTMTPSSQAQFFNEENSATNNLVRPHFQNTFNGYQTHAVPYEQAAFHNYTNSGGSSNAYFAANNLPENKSVFLPGPKHQPLSSIKSGETDQNQANIYGQRSQAFFTLPQMPSSSFEAISQQRTPAYSYQTSVSRSGPSPSDQKPSLPHNHQGHSENTNNNKAESACERPELKMNLPGSSDTESKRNSKEKPETKQGEHTVDCINPHECLISPHLKKTASSIQTYYKPTISVVDQLVEAFIHSGKKEMHPYQVYEELQKLFPYYSLLEHKKKKSWMSSVRHGLTTPQFKRKKVLEKTKSCIKKGGLWSLNDDFDPELTPVRTRKRNHKTPERGSSRRKQNLHGKTRRDYSDFNNRFYPSRYFKQAPAVRSQEIQTASMQSSFAPGPLVFPSGYPMMSFVPSQQLYTPPAHQWMQFQQPQTGIQRLGAINSNCNNMNAVVAHQNPPLLPKQENFDGNCQQPVSFPPNNQSFATQLNGPQPLQNNQDLRGLVNQIITMNESMGHPHQFQMQNSNPTSSQANAQLFMPTPPVQQVNSCFYSQSMTRPPVLQATFTANGLVKDKDLLTHMKMDNHQHPVQQQTSHQQL